MAVQLMTDEYSETGGLPEPGRYMFIVKEPPKVENSRNGNPQLSVVLEITSGTPASSIDKRQYEYFQLSGKGINRLYSLLVATGIVTRETLRKMAEAKQVVSFEEAALTGRSFCGQLTAESYTNDAGETKHKVALGFDIWAVTDEAAKDIPKAQHAYATMTSVINRLRQSEGLPAVGISGGNGATAKPAIPAPPPVIPPPPPAPPSNGNGTPPKPPAGDPLDDLFG